MTSEQQEIEDALQPFNDWALSDINFLAANGKTLGGFILGSCFIDQISKYCYGSNDSRNFQKFVSEYLPKYRDLKLVEYLRHKLVHHYSFSGTFLLASHAPFLHFQEAKGQIYLNLENFYEDLKQAFLKYKSQAMDSADKMKVVLKWCRRHQPIKFFPNPVPSNHKYAGGRT